MNLAIKNFFYGCFLVLAISLITNHLTRQAKASPLTGNAAVAAPPTALGSDRNPAQAALLKSNEFDARVIPFTSETYYLRYPGFPTVTKNSNGFSFTSIPSGSLLFKLGPRVGLGITSLVPPTPNFALDVEKLPLYIFGQPSYVNAKIDARSNGGITMVFAYRLLKSLSLGLKVSYLSYAAVVHLFESDSKAEIGTIDIANTNFNLGTGIYWEIVDNILIVGCAVNIFTMSDNKQALNISSMSDLGKGNENQNNGGMTSSINTPLSGIVIGLGVRPVKFLILMADVEYNRAAIGTKQLSLADLEEKEKDLYDTTSVKSGAELKITPRHVALLGFQYEPSDVGPGSKGKDGKTGFGTIDALQIYAGQGELKPYWAISGGMRFNLGKKVSGFSAKENQVPGKEMVKNKKPSIGYFPWTFEIGGRFQKASLGIAEDGDQPAAYAQTKISIPLRFQWRF